MGGPNTVNKAQKIGTFQIQSSAYGLPIPWGAGRGRIACNLMWLDGFTAHEHDTQQGGGKGGGSTNQSFTYTADLLLGICDAAAGPIRSLNSIFVDKSVFTGPSCVTGAGFSEVKLGNSGQSPSTLLTTKYPDAALGYDTTAYLVGSQYLLNSSGGLQNHSVEVDFALQVGSGIVDANPGDYGGVSGIVSTFLTNMIPQWSAGYIGDLSAYGTYCLAANLLISPTLDTQQQASSVIDEWMLATNSECWIRGDGTFQVTPLGDATVTGNGATFTPNLTPEYDLDDDDFIVDNPGDDPITIDTPNLDDLFNKVQVSFQNRQHQYNDETVTGFDQASIDEIGERKQDPTSLPSIKDPIIARLAAQLLVQKTSSLARPFTFNLPWWADRLEETNLVTLTSVSMGLDRVLARIEEIDEDGDTGKLTFKTVEVLVGTANAPAYASQTANGVVTDYEADPGDVNPPVLFIPPTTITNGDLEAWAAVASNNANWGGAQVWIAFDDGSGGATNYAQVGTINGRARYGFSTNDLPLRPDPDLLDTLDIDLSASGGTLSSATQADVDAFASLCWLGGELIAYRDVTLTGSNTYALSGELRRGGYGSIIADHPAGTEFVRLDSAIFKYPYLTGQIGKTIHIKFLSFNIFGRQVQDLADVTDYTLTLTTPGTLPGSTTLSLQSTWASAQFTLACSAAQTALNYTFRIYLSDGVTLVHASNATPAQSFTYTQDMAAADGHIDRTYVCTVTPSNASGDGQVSTPLTVSNPAPAAVTGVGHTGSGASVTINWSANSEADKAGYVGYYSQTNGFDPTLGAGALFYEGNALTATLSGLTPGQTYYVRIAAFDTWSDDARTLNFSAQHSFTA